MMNNRSMSQLSSLAQDVEPLVNQVRSGRLDDRVQIVYYTEDPKMVKSRRVTDAIFSIVIGICVSIVSATIYAIVNIWLAKRAQKSTNEDKIKKELQSPVHTLPVSIDKTLADAQVPKLSFGGLKSIVKVVKSESTNDEDAPKQTVLALNDHIKTSSNNTMSSFLLFVYRNECPWARRASPQVAEANQWIKRTNAFKLANQRSIPLVLYAIKLDDIHDQEMQSFFSSQGIPYFLFYDARTKEIGRFTAPNPDGYTQEIEDLYMTLQDGMPIK